MTFTALTPKDTFEPLSSNHPTVGTLCIRCNYPFQEGEIPAIIDRLGEQDKTSAYIAKSEVNLSCHVIHQVCVDKFYEW